MLIYVIFCQYIFILYALTVIHRLTYYADIALYVIYYSYNVCFN